MTSVEPSEGTSTSSDADRMAATVSAVNILAQGKRNMVCGEIPTAVNQFQEACKLLAKAYGETAKECADAYFCYGQALLDLARMENGVLGNALQGVPDTDEEESSDSKSDQFEKVEMEADEREKLREEVYDAMADKDKAAADAKKAGETMEISMDTKEDSPDKKAEVKKKSDDQTTEGKAEVQKDDKKDVEKDKSDVQKEETKSEKPQTVKPDTKDKDEDEAMETDLKDTDKKPDEPKVEKTDKDEPKVAKTDKDEPKVAKTDKDEPKVAKTDKDEPKVAKTDKDEPKVAKTDKDEPKVAKTDKDEPKVAKTDKDEPKVEKTDEDKSKVEKTETNQQKVEKTEKDKPKVEKTDKDKPKVEKTDKDKPEVEKTDKDKPEVEKTDKDAKKEDTKGAEGEEKKEGEEKEVEEKEGEEKEGEEEEKKEGEEKDGEESMEDEEDGTEEEAEDTAEDVSQDESQDGENPDDVSNLQLAWEMLELAKLIYSKDESKEAKLRTAESHLKLGEVSMETEQYEESIKDFNICLTVQKEILELDNRLLAETYYQLGLAYCFAKRFTESVDSYNAAIKCIESRISKLDEILEKATPEEKASKDFDTPVYKANKEVGDLRELLPDIKSKIDDCDDERKNMDELKNLAKEALGGLAAVVAPTKFEGETSKEEVKTMDISHLIKRKRKSEDNDDDKTKKARQEDGAGDAPPVTNGHAEKEEAKEAMETKS